MAIARSLRVMKCPMCGAWMSEKRCFECDNDAQDVMFCAGCNYAECMKYGESEWKVREYELSR